MRTRNAAHRGFTLVEVMVAVAVAAVMFLSVLSLLSQQARVVAKTQERLYVSRVLESRLEEMRDLTFNEIAALSSPITFAVVPDIDVYGKTINQAVADPEFRRTLQSASGTVTISDVQTDLKRIEVAVTWNSAIQGNQVTMKTATYVTRDGLNRR